jgi:hypothetical protein
LGVNKFLGVVLKIGGVDQVIKVNTVNQSGRSCFGMTLEAGKKDKRYIG